MAAKKKASASAARSKAVEALDAFVSPDEAFLAAIRTAPHEDGPRLVYADHLLESRDEMRRLRGELIVAQCEAPRLVRHRADWRRVLTREHHLRESLAFSEENRAGRIEWDRGFASALTTTPQTLERSWKAVAGHPIREISLSESRKDLRPTLRELRFIARTFPQVETVRFATNREANGAFDLKGFVDVPDKGTKAWANGKLPDESVRDHLTFLHLDDLSFEERRLGLRAYLELPLPKLRGLSLRGSDATSMLEMSDRPLGSLRWSAEGDARRAPLTSLTNLTTLDELDVNVLLDRALARAIATSSIRTLTLGYGTTSDGLRAFQPPAPLRHLALSFAGRDISPSTHYQLPPGVFSELEHLELGRFDVRTRLDASSFPKLREISLHECRFDVATLAKLPCLETLTFTQCGIEHDAEAALRQRLPNVFFQFQ